MPTRSAPWIVLTTDQPGLDAKNRDAINEWCGIMGKQSHRRQRKKNIQFPSRAVNWKSQKRPNSDALKVANLLNQCEDQESSSGRPSPPQRPKSTESTTSNVTTSNFLTKKTLKSEPRVQIKKEPSSAEAEPRSPDEEPSSKRTLALLLKDGSMGIRVDPFDCVPGTRDDPRQGEVLDYYKQILDPGVVATFFVFDMRSTYGSMPLECLMDDEFRPLGLASIAGTMSSVRHAAVNREYVLEQLGKGMLNLRRRLSRPGGAEGDIILISVMFLAATAYVTKDIEGFEVHKRHLKELVAARGGLDHLGYGGGTKTVMLQWDAAWKLSTGRSLWIDDRPPNEPIYPALPLDERTRALIDSLPIGFRALCRSGLVCVELMQMLSRMTIAMSYTSPRSIPYHPKTGQYDDYMSVSSLQSLGALNDSSQSPSRKLEILLTLGLILFSSTAFNEMRATPVIFRGPKDALYKRLLFTKTELFDFCDTAKLECYQWVWAVAVDAWRDASRELLPQGQQLLAKFHSKYASRWKTSGNLVDILKRFFWTEDLVKFHQRSFEDFKATRGEI
ncbi:hypothetical protein H2200_006843 [Cladophialophora chaetospira]|uniref:Uncharacterized protein n=1 Tax=Cladophialophora chaetospira TaxID=386627 RepID=A0AA39CHK6_9EURO|nr:hypothetical protein H2200_006843 [Cladophialophora chaetospira]